MADIDARETADDTLSSIDENFAANLRHYRETRGLTQEEVARRMTAAGFGFSQTTIWKIEQGKRPVRLNEAAALAKALEVTLWTDLTSSPERFNLWTQLDMANRKAYGAYDQVKAATDAYLWAQLELTVLLRNALDAGIAVPEVWTSWMERPPEVAALEAIFEARIAADQDAANTERLNAAVDQVLEALRDRGFEPILSPDDVVRDGPDPEQLA